MSDETMQAPSDLIRWLKMLALPRWAKCAIAAIMLLILCSALILLGWGLYYRELELISSSVTMLTVGLPVGLIVVALVFGDGGAAKLQALTKLVLQKEVPDAIQKNFESVPDKALFHNPAVVPTVYGCIADYVVTAEYAPGSAPTHALESGHPAGKTVKLEFKLELNVKKANLVIWIPRPQNDTEYSLATLFEPYQSCFFGASKEGYVQNTTPLLGILPNHVGVVFIKSLGNDFLLDPAERLYFAQDLAFFVRGLLNSEVRHG